MTYTKSILSLFLLLITLVSCSSDDGEGGQTETQAIVGIWILTEVNLNIPQDSNEDGTPSTNMVDELPCLTGTLTIDASGVWSATVVDLTISPVTGDFYVVNCAETLTYAGRYSYQNGQLNLDSSSFSGFTLSGTRLTENIGENLPGVLSYVYEKQ